MLTGKLIKLFLFPVLTQETLDGGLVKADMTADRITALGYYTFQVYNIDGWSTDGGARLKSEEKGCGALTGWDWRERTSTAFAGAYFNLPWIMKDGCVERAIVSAGGPKLSCEFTGYDIGVAFLPAKKRSLAIDAPPVLKRQMISASPSLPSRSSVQSTTYTVPEPTYTPEPWGPGDTVILTTTVESFSKSTYITEIVLASYSPTSSSSSTAPSGSSNPSTDGRCGADFGGTTCSGTPYGECCSIWGWCGSASGNCGHLVCDIQYGTCDPVPEEPPISQDGICGFNSFIGATCAGSAFGDCCNWSGECGSGTAYCSPENCDPEHGNCGGSSLPVSTDGTCSSNSDPVGATCAGSGFGDCCSEWGYCGDTNAFCGTGCQSAFGSCMDT